MDKDESLRRQYDTSLEDLRNFKEVQWKITTTSYALFGGIVWGVGIARVPPCLWQITIALIVVAAVIGIHVVDNAISKARGVIRNIQGQYEESAKDIIGRQHFSGNNGTILPYFPAIFDAAIAAGGIISSLMVWMMKT